MDDMALGMRDMFGRSTRHLQMIAENLANSNTPGYRAGAVMSEPVSPFDRILNRHVVAETERDATDLSPGAVRMTDRPLDFSINGDGFFVVRSDKGDYLTRNGSFEQGTDGVLRTAAGHAVVDVNGDVITIPNGVRQDQIQVGEDGELRAGDRRIGTFRLDRVASERDLERVGTSLFTAPEARREPAETSRILGRTLETSNTVVFQELSNMMLLSRTVEALQRAQTNQDQSQRKMIDVLAS